MSTKLIELTELYDFSAEDIKSLLINKKIKECIKSKRASKTEIIECIKGLVLKNGSRLEIPQACKCFYKKYKDFKNLYIISDTIRDFDDKDGDNDDGSAASSSIKTNVTTLTFDECLKGSQGICYYLLTPPKNSEKLIQQYGNFALLIKSLINNVDFILSQFEDEIESSWKLKGFTIGKTNTQGYKSRHFSVFNINTWRKRGIKNRWDRPPYNGGKDEFKVMVVLAGFTLHWLRICKYIENGKAGDQHNFALAVEQALTTYYLYQRKDRRVTNFTSESGQGMAKGICGLVYVALKLEKQELNMSSKTQSHNKRSFSKDCISDDITTICQTHDVSDIGEIPLDESYSDSEDNAFEQDLYSIDREEKNSKLERSDINKLKHNKQSKDDRKHIKIVNNNKIAENRRLLYENNLNDTEEDESQCLLL